MVIAEAVAAGWEIITEFVTPGTTPITTGSVATLAPGVMERVASTETPQPHLAVVAMPVSTPSLNTLDRVVVADQIADPGNLGTILRSAEAAGVDAVIVTPGSVDPYNPKTVRASAGALFHVPIITAQLSELSSAGLRLIGTSSHQGDDFRQADWSGRIAIIVGNEAHGMAPDAPVDTWVCIHHHGRAESLNVAMALTLVVFEAQRS